MKRIRNSSKNTAKQREAEKLLSDKLYKQGKMRTNNTGRWMRKLKIR